MKVGLRHSGTYETDLNYAAGKIQHSDGQLIVYMPVVSVDTFNKRILRSLLMADALDVESLHPDIISPHVDCWSDGRVEIVFRRHRIYPRGGSHAHERGVSC